MDRQQTFNAVAAPESGDEGAVTNTERIVAPPEGASIASAERVRPASSAVHKVAAGSLANMSNRDGAVPTVTGGRQVQTASGGGPVHTASAGGPVHTASDSDQVAFLESILTGSPDVITVVSSDGVIVFASEAITQVFGVSSDEVLGRSVYDMEAIHPDDREQVRASFRRLLGGEVMTDRRRFRVRHPEGHGVVLEARHKVLLDDDLQVVSLVTVTTDVSEQASLERQLYQANRAKSEFLSRMSHELRTPLNSILGFAQLLELDDLNAAQYESLRHISRAGSHLLELINEILDMARIDAGKLDLALEPVSLDEVVREVAVLMQPQAEQFDVAVDVAPIHAPYVSADRQRLRQAITNLVSNAIKYNRRGGLVRIHGDETSAGHVRLTVTDTGPGIPSDRQGAVFAPFERLGAEQTTVEGTGVGLTLAKRVIEAMGGAIGFDSKVGLGSTFWIELTAVEESVRVPAAAPERIEPSINLPAGRILYIEDDPANLIFLERVLERHPGVQLVPASAGRIGLQLAAEERPSLILLDVHLPDMAGIDVLRKLNANPATSGVPVVALSADASAKQVRNMLEEGAVAYLYKPIDVGELERTLGAVFAGESPERDPEDPL